MNVSPARFAQLAEDAFAAIPTELTAIIDNVVLSIEDDPPADDPRLLGVYDGIALTERGADYGGVLPDRIVIYRNSILSICDTEEDVVREVGITVVHEIAHHFGIDDRSLHALGYS